MVLQEILFPNSEVCMEKPLYFRIDENRSIFHVESGMIELKKNAYIYFDTLFNSFSLEKWLKYTRMNNLKLQIDIKGRCRLTVLRKQIIGTEMFVNVINEKILTSQDVETFECEIPCKADDKGIVCLAVEALEKGFEFHGGRYTSDVDEAQLNPVHIAMDICTFKRETYIKHNVDILNKWFINNPESPLFGHLDVFISDNGKTLDRKALQSEHVHIAPNKNAGGAGGFCRGMIEIIDDSKKSNKQYTNVLVMDDDVLINPDAIQRTYTLLRLMKPQYKGKTIAGAMMRLDRRNIQHECCGWWDGDIVNSRKTWLDMIDIYNVLRNEQEPLVNFNAWWYSCIPMEKISNDNLPLPIFIRFDDVEFGLRSGSDIISLNGICLWHEPFEYKYSSSMDYYHMRNGLILNALHVPEFSAKRAARHMRHEVLQNLMRYRYSNVELIFRGVDDFCEGPKALFAKDVEKLHKEIMGMSDKFQPLDQLDVAFDEEVYRSTQIWSERKGHRIFRLMTFNGLFLPAKGKSIVNAAANVPIMFYRKQKVLNYDVLGNRGFVSTRNRSQTLACIRKMFAMEKKLEANYARLREEYRTAKPEITSRAFWDKYLNLK